MLLNDRREDLGWIDIYFLIILEEISSFFFFFFAKKQKGIFYCKNLEKSLNKHISYFILIEIKHLIISFINFLFY